MSMFRRHGSPVGRAAEGGVMAERCPKHNLLSGTVGQGAKGAEQGGR
jgi:hypothetical protein